MLIIYRILINIAYFLSPLIIILRLIRKKEDPKRYKEKFCFFTKKKIKGKLNLDTWCKCGRISKCCSHN